MTLSLHTIAPSKGAKKTKKRIGRGYGSGKGTTAGRGTKGQRARTGGRNGLKLKGLKQMILGFPKSRGFASTKAQVFDIRAERVMKVFNDNATVTVAELKKKGLLPKQAVYVKLIGGGEEAVKPLKIVGIRATQSVKTAIEKAGGTFIEAQEVVVTKKSKKE
ncbi:MAG: 50S ribosomal protein L15 [bacterium]|nr:50S ribosomal protein L15 [bacterium]